MARAVDLVAIFRVDREPVLVAAFQRFIASPNPTLVALGLRALLSAGDPSAIQTVAQQSAALASSPSWSAIIGEIEHYYVNTNLGAIRALGVMATDQKNQPALRAAAAMALARAHSKPTLAYLAQLLDDPDPLLKARGVRGLAMFANNVPIGSYEPAIGNWRWHTEEPGFWKSWWTANQAALMK